MAEYRRRQAVGEITFNGTNWVERAEQPTLKDIESRFEEIKSKVPEVLREARRLFPNESIADLTRRIEQTLSTGASEPTEGEEPTTTTETAPTPTTAPPVGCVACSDALACSVCSVATCSG